MKLAYKFFALAVVALLWTSAYAVSPEAEYTKTIKKEFSIDPDGMAQFITKYGKLDIKTWEKNRVKIEVNIRVEARNEDAAQDVFDRIRIDFTNSDKLVKAETVVESSSTWKWWGSSKSDFTVDYEVYLPASLTLDASHRYGDMMLAGFAGRVIVNLKYGNLRMQTLSCDLDLDLSYSNGTIASTRNADIEAAYSNLTVRKVQDVDFTSKYSNVVIETGGKLTAESKYDSYRIGQAESFNNNGSFGNVEIASVSDLSAESRYTDFKIKELRNSAELDLQYGGAKVENILKGFSLIRLNGRYADFKLKVEEGASYQLEATGKYAGILYPSTLQVTYEKEQPTFHEVSGHLGVANARSVIKASLDYGGLKMQ